MGELHDFNAFKRKKEEDKNVESPLQPEEPRGEMSPEHSRMKRKKFEFPPSIVDIGSDRLKEISVIINQYNGQRNEKTIEAAKSILLGWTAGEIVDFLKNANSLNLKAKPAFTTAALEMLEFKELGKR